MTFLSYYNLKTSWQISKASGKMYFLMNLTFKVAPLTLKFPVVCVCDRRVLTGHQVSTTGNNSLTSLPHMVGGARSV